MNLAEVAENAEATVKNRRRVFATANAHVKR